jgi:polysaccharide pyruvyl transferase WcaK-like protein
VSDPPRILVEPNADHLLNHGDTAMLQIAVERLFALWPNATIHVLTENPARLERLCPGVRALDVRGRRLWFDDYAFTYTLHRLLPSAAARRLVDLARRNRRDSPGIASKLVRVRAALHRKDTRPLDEFLAVVSDADLVVSTGAGAFTDHFATLALTILELFDGAKRRGAVAAALGQGMGPMTNATLMERARAVLPSLDLITLREHRHGGPLLERLGVDPRRILTTGDDAIELAYRERSAAASTEPRIGVNLRIARYSNVDPRAAETVGAAVRAAATRHAAELLPIPISHHPNERDGDVVAALLQSSAGAASASDPPQAAVAQVGRCRIAVSGSYHAAVFALAQGVPAVGLTSSPYYDAKFDGLREQFGGLLGVVSLTGDDLAARLGAAIDEAWRGADEVRPVLLDRAAQQVDAGRRAYARLGELLGSGDGRS